MMRSAVISALVIAGLAHGGVALAQQPGAPKDEARELNFEDDVIEGSFLKPDSSLVEGEKRGGAGSLLKIRQDFVAEIVKSAEDI